MMTGELAQHMVSIAPVREPHRGVTGVFGSGELPWIEGGRGGWFSTERDGRDPITEWAATSAAEQELVLRLEHMLSGNVRAAIERLESFCRSPKQGVAPPLVVVRGLLPAAARVWAMQDVAVSGAERYATGEYERCIVTVSLLAADNIGDGLVLSNRVPVVYVTRKNDTLLRVASRYYPGRVAANAARILSLNKTVRGVKRDVRAKQPAGLKLRLP